MTRPNARPEELELFDLPLAAPASRKRRPERPSGPQGSDSLDLFPSTATTQPPVERDSPAPEAAARASEVQPAHGTSAGDAEAGVPAGFADRIGADLLDLAATFAVLGTAWAGALLMGVRTGLSAWPAFAALGLVFSFLYQTVPLAFWGSTPGMARRDLVARSADGRGISFRQAMLRWAGWALTLALAGSPWLATLSGRSLGDRLSASHTARRPG